MRHLAFPGTISNGDDVALARRLIVEALRATPDVLQDPPPEALVTGLGSAGVDMQARFWINPPRRREAVDALDGAIAAVEEALTKAGVDLPYPTSQLLFHDQTEEMDGDRSCQREGWPAKGGRVPRPRWKAHEEARREKPDEPG